MLQVFGEWMTWGEWGQCSVTCGGGTRLRSRACDLTVGGPDRETLYCQGEDFEARKCHEYDCEPVAKTCQAWVDTGLEDSGITADVDPMGGGSPFKVKCVINDTLVFSEVGHDQMKRTEVHGWEMAGEYRVHLQYTVDMESMLALADVSEGCRQWISWECEAATMWSVVEQGLAMNFWNNRNGEKKLYFGGAPPDFEGCECGVDGSCAGDEGNRCNCDANDDVLRKDSGYITNLKDLPITAFFAGDTGADHEYGYYTIGPFACHGTKN